jgi:hypothetical protein
MDIRPPYGYRDIVPLNKAHRVILPRLRWVPPELRSLTAVPLSFAEFAPACRDYPIAFVSTDAGKTYVAMIIAGIVAQQNLFLLADDTWDAAVYVPAYVRRYPFCMTRVSVDGKEKAERIACVERRALNDKGDALYDAKGETLPFWEEHRKLLFEFEGDLVRTEEISRKLADLGLYEEFTMQAVPHQGEPVALTGMYRVDEARLNDLPAASFKELGQTGILARVYAHLISLANFGRLLERRVARTRPGTAPPAGTA